ncbi:hypothetical protein HMPREF1979_02543 [Actinomyces johnsonii F0542]|uniref:Uncharacterized protein n=1 Tax=Actinomyces johnsonii F0542 TaxID=1321818 RepID=U1QJW0_9ACTO|nr:hypothetical protein HMPREF1979_02543 [Actinomyces johnsonii F0542]
MENLSASALASHLSRSLLRSRRTQVEYLSISSSPFTTIYRSDK